MTPPLSCLCSTNLEPFCAQIDYGIRRVTKLRSSFQINECLPSQVIRHSLGIVAASTHSWCTDSAWSRALLHKLTVAQQPPPPPLLPHFNPNYSVLTYFCKTSSNQISWKSYQRLSIDLRKVPDSNLGLNADYCEVFRDYPQFLHANPWGVTWNRSRPFPSTSFCSTFMKHLTIWLPTV